MVEWISANIGTLLVCLALCAAVAGIVIVMIRDNKRGRSPCGGSCGHCPMAGRCHKN